MNRIHLYIPVRTEAMRTAARVLAGAGVCFANDPDQSNAVLLPVPTGPELLQDLPADCLIIGGRLEALPGTQPRLDLLQDPVYVAKNAALTAEAALGLILSALPCRLADAPTLILGWGRIGKSLARMLRALGVPVTVCARKASDRAMLQALGYAAADPGAVPGLVGHYRCIVNTVPAPILSDAAGIRPGCFLLDLASGVFLPGETVVSARGLPGKCRPEASGQLIAEAVLRHFRGGRAL